MFRSGPILIRQFWPTEAAAASRRRAEAAGLLQASSILFVSPCQLAGAGAESPGHFTAGPLCHFDARPPAERAAPKDAQTCRHGSQAWAAATTFITTKSARRVVASRRRFSFTEPPSATICAAGCGAKISSTFVDKRNERPVAHIIRGPSRCARTHTMQAS
jgi:hypothetical protein